MNGNNKVFIASLFGSKLAESVPRFEKVNNTLATHVLPVIPFLPLKNKVEVSERDYSFSAADNKATPPNLKDQFFPLTFRRRRTLQAGENSEPWYTFPYEPLISINGENLIIKKAPAKAANFVGTVKEYFSQGDYEVTITGFLFGENLIGDVEQCFPREDFERLRDYCTSPGGIEVRCEPLQLLNINYLVVDSFSFPFTKGNNVLAYELKCSSDFTADLLLEIE